MNGAESLIRSLVKAGVNMCFANPGTSEMHLVQAIDAVPEMRAVLSLFEGVCTGAADGYGRMTQMPATTLLHLGPGMANGMANLHNARRASTPIINLIGNHPLYHIDYDTVITSNIELLAQGVSAWVKGDSTATSVAHDGMQALQAACTPSPGSVGQVATLILPVDACWGDAQGTADALPMPERSRVDEATINKVASVIDAHTMLLLDGDGVSLAARIAASRIALKTGCRVSTASFPSRIDGGAGTPVCERLPYFPEHILATLAGITRLVLAGAQAPASFFAYPQVPSSLVPEGCAVVTLSDKEANTTEALLAIAELMKAPLQGYAVNEHLLLEGKQTSASETKLSTASIASMVAQYLPENAIICGDSGGGGAAFTPTQSAVPNTWLNLTGGSIGQGGPVATGAALACPERRVLALLGDGAAMYTNQAFWTQAREGLNVTTVIFNNSKYGILETEYLRLGVQEVGDRAAALFDLTRPAIDFVALAESMGVPGRAARTEEDFAAALQLSLAQPGPFLIEAKL